MTNVMAKKRVSLCGLNAALMRFCNAVDAHQAKLPSASFNRKVEKLTAIFRRSRAKAAPAIAFQALRRRIRRDRHGRRSAGRSEAWRLLTGRWRQGPPVRGALFVDTASPERRFRLRLIDAGCRRTCIWKTQGARSCRPPTKASIS